MKENVFFPPVIGRFVRLHPSHSYNYPTVRMEFYGCELDGRRSNQSLSVLFYFSAPDTDLGYTLIRINCVLQGALCRWECRVDLSATVKSQAVLLPPAGTLGLGTLGWPVWINKGQSMLGKPR